ncbi:MAG: hypothetical protein HY815_16275 [Candidatus Riflebacteria bacterium]|nr:hypothetical protein [Candidatus Riflebacteria bacterium]
MVDSAGKVDWSRFAVVAGQSECHGVNGGEFRHVGNRGEAPKQGGRVREGGPKAERERRMHGPAREVVEEEFVGCEVMKDWQANLEELPFAELERGKAQASRSGEA